MAASAAARAAADAAARSLSSASCFAFAAAAASAAEGVGAANAGSDAAGAAGAATFPAPASPSPNASTPNASLDPLNPPKSVTGAFPLGAAAATATAPPPKSKSLPPNASDWGAGEDERTSGKRVSTVVARPPAGSPPAINASDVKETVAEASGSTRFGRSGDAPVRDAPVAGGASNAAKPPNPPNPESAAAAAGGSRAANPPGNDPKPPKSSAAAGATGGGAAGGGAAPPPGSRLAPDPKSPKSPKSAMGAGGAAGAGAGAGVTSICDGAGVFPPFCLIALYVSCMATLKWSRDITSVEPPVMPARSCLMRSGASFALLRNFTASSGATRPCLPPGSFE